MRNSIITAVVLALAVNAGVVFALPLLAGAIENALPGRAPIEIRDVELVEIEESQPIPMISPSVPKEEVQVRQPSQPPSPREQKPPDRPPAQPGEWKRLPDMLRDADFDFDPDALMPTVDLALPVTSGSGSISDSGAGDAPPAREIRSLDEVDRRPMKVYHVQPVYPLSLLEASVESEVTLSLTIGADGTVDGVRVERGSGYRDFDTAAVEAVRRWRFSPALAGDRPTAVRAIQRIRFSLR